MIDYHGQSKREILKDKVIALVNEFVKTEGGITSVDLQMLFGPPCSPFGGPPLYEIAYAIGQKEITLV